LTGRIAGTLNVDGKAIQRHVLPEGEMTMSLGDKVGNKAEELKGAAKEKVGDLTNNESMQAEGAAEKTAARAKQAGEHLADAGRDARDALRG
jgi:uncharacterized protein YjbJ (UPF0337 family)